MEDAPTLGAQFAAQSALLARNSDHGVHESGRCVPASEAPDEVAPHGVFHCTVVATPADTEGAAIEEASNFSVVFDLDAQGAIIETSPLCIAAG